MGEYSKKQGLDAENAVLDPNTKRYIHIDMMRVLCIFFVGVDHGYKEYSIHNVLFTQSWVLQCLWLICGMSWSLSRMPIFGYLWRLAIYFVIGVSLNWLAWLYKGKDWEHDPMGVMYQFAFIIGLMAYSTMTACLKVVMKRTVAEAGAEPVPQVADDFRSDLEGHPPAQSLHTFPGATSQVLQGLQDTTTTQASNTDEKGQALLEDAAPPADVRPPKPPLTASERRAVKVFACALLTQWVAMAGLGVLFANVKTEIVAKVIDFILGESAQFWTDGLQDKDFFGQLLATFGSFGLAAIGARVFRSPRLAPYLVWVLIFFIYCNRIFILPLTFGQYGGGVARFFVGFELFLIGLTGAVMGMRWAAALKSWMARYYVLMLLAAAFLWNPDWAIRMDEHPPNKIAVILRVEISEILWVVAFMSSGALWFTEESWPEWIRSWLADFALALFLVHKAVHVAVDAPFNWFLIFGLLPLLTLWRRHGLTWLCGKARPPWSPKAPRVGVAETVVVAAASLEPEVV